MIKIENRHIFHWLIPRLIIWRLGLLLVAAIAIKLLPFKLSFPYSETLLVPTGSPLFWSWANFDGVHYLGIAKNGYFAQFTQAFFPLYPLLIRWLNPLFRQPIVTGLVISHLSLVGALWLLYRLLRLDLPDKIVKRILIFLMLFPTSFFFVSLYTESLFLLFVVATFLAARKKHFFWAGLAGALAAATRVLGVLVIPALIIELLVSHKRQFINWLYVLLPTAGILVYMYYLNVAFGDPLYFLHAQSAFGAGRSDKLILLYQVFWRYAKMVTTVPITSLLYYTVSLEFLSGIVFFVLSLLAFKYVRRSYAVFGILAYLTPTLTGTFSSLPRYVLVLFPTFMVLGQIKNSKLRFALLAVSSSLLAINVALFTRGYWVS